MSTYEIEQNVMEVAKNPGHRKELGGQDKEVLGPPIGKEVGISKKSKCSSSCPLY